MLEAPNKIRGEIKISSEILNEKVEDISDLKQLIEKNSTKNISIFLETILGGAILLNPSDLHFEPREESTVIRARVDGILHDVFSLDTNRYRTLCSRIKLLSELKLNITDRPQDGRFSIILKDFEIEIRTSTLPSEYGESIVLRILNPKDLPELEGLGIDEKLLTIFKKEITKPNGMIIVTGPTGSGKTTTLYAFLKKIKNPEIKIITIEDPIEYHLDGISQTQVNQKRGYDFASGLKSIVRQDPDVILVGEIRDQETVEIAIQAALTGHLVFSTLHANDAPATIARLIALGADPINIAPAVNLIIAQRLVRKVCDKCRKNRPITKEELEIFKLELKDVGITVDEKTEIPEITGCNQCNGTGYRGRIGIHEMLLIDAYMEMFIAKNPSVSEIRKEAQRKGMTNLRQDGLMKVLKGITTIEELNRLIE